MDVSLIANPVSGGGRGEKFIDPVMGALSARFGGARLFRTEKLGHARQLAQQQADAAVDLIVALGGDGTVSECVDGIQLSKNPSTPLAIIPAGTGSDFVRGFARASSVAHGAATNSIPFLRTVDLGAITLQNADGTTTLRHFNNICSLGVSGHIAERVNASRRLRFLPGKAVFFLHSLLGLLTYRPVTVVLSVDSHEVMTLKITLAICANGRYFGGGMKVAPMAEMDDGLLDIIIIPALSKPRVLLEFLGIYSGRHMKNPQVIHMRARRFSAEAHPGEMLVTEVDGEAVACQAMTIDIKLGALTLAM